MVFTKQQGQKEERTLDGAQGDLGCPCVLGRSGVGNSQVNSAFVWQWVGVGTGMGMGIGLHKRGHAKGN